MPTFKDTVDKTLIKLVHSETVGNYQITAILTRFGGLCVIARDVEDAMKDIYQGDNILEARNWCQDRR
jgi:hypothetical protein